MLRILLALIFAAIFASPAFTSSVSGNKVGWWQNASFVPTSISGCVFWMDPSDSGSISLNYNSTSVTGTGSPIGQYTISTTSDLTSVLSAGMYFRIGATDVYVISTITSTTITTTTPLINLYVAQTIYQSGVSQANDLSGNSNPAVQATGSAQPAYAQNQINGLNALVLNGSSDYLNFTNAINANPSTVFGVANFKSGTNQDAIVGNFGSSSIIGISGGDMYLYYGVVAATPFSADGNPHLIGAVIPSTGGTLYIDGAGYSGSGTATSTYSTIGNGFDVFSGSIAEIVIYNRALNGTEITQLQNYFNAKWGTP